MFGRNTRTAGSGYTKPGRLADVLALIQVLAMDEHTYRSEGGLGKELQGPPRSAIDWPELAQKHPEFFRVKPTGKNRISLIARHATPREGAGRPALSADYASKLLTLAVDLHDREVRRSQNWQIWLPFLGVVVGGAIALIGVWLKSYLSATG